jgi:hypothetical protein
MARLCLHRRCGVRTGVAAGDCAISAAGQLTMHAPVPGALEAAGMHPHGACKVMIMQQTGAADRSSSQHRSQHRPQQHAQACLIAIAIAAL